MHTSTSSASHPATTLEQLDAPNPGSSQQEAKRQDRIYYLDNVRAIAMLLGLVLHSALTYAKPSQNFWILGDREGSMAMDMSIWFIHLFRMSLFFLIAGYFAKLLVTRRSVGSFLKNRALRILLPFLVSFRSSQSRILSSLVLR